jgi:hypothetical protein
MNHPLRNIRRRRIDNGPGHERTLGFMPHATMESKQTAAA